MIKRGSWLTAASVLVSVAASPAPSMQTLAVDRAFTILTPPGSVFRPGAGDSVAGRIMAGDRVIDVDYGVSADPLTSGNRGQEVWTRKVMVDGRPARLALWSATDGSYRLGLHVPAIAPSVMGPVKLTLTTTLPAMQPVAAVIQMIDTIRFVRN